MHPIPLLLALCFPLTLIAQPVELTYYLPDTNYDPAVPTRLRCWGFRWVSTRRTHPDGRLLPGVGRRLAPHHLTGIRPYLRAPPPISAHRHHRSQPGTNRLPAGNPPPTVRPAGSRTRWTWPRLRRWYGWATACTGNEPSGANAALLVAYYLAAAPAAEVAPLLDRTIVLMDPFINPTDSSASPGGSTPAVGKCSAPIRRIPNKTSPGPGAGPTTTGLI